MSLYLLGLLIVVLSVVVVFGIFWLGLRLSRPGEEKALTDLFWGRRP
jgi:hypothetical protein